MKTNIARNDHKSALEQEQHANGLQWRQKIFIIFVESLFEKIAIRISRRPLHVMFCCILIAISLNCGLAKLDIAGDVENIFLPKGNEASRDLHKARNIGFELELRQEEINIWSGFFQECLAEMIKLHNIIIKIEHFDEYCLRPKSNCRCATTNLTEVFGYQKENLVGNISRRIEAALKNGSFLMSNGRTLQDNFCQVFGVAASNGSLDCTNALRYFMKKYTNGEKDKAHREDILEWKKIFLDEISSFLETCANIVNRTERSLDDLVAESSGSDMKFLAMAFPIIAIFTTIVNVRCTDGRFSLQLLGLGAFLSIFLGVTSGLGLPMFLNVPSNIVVAFLAFAVVSIGIDKVFIILHELNEMFSQNLPVMHVLSGTMAKCGPAILMTTLADLLAFAMNCSSIFPSVRILCKYAVPTVFFVSLMLMTFFVVFMWFEIKRIDALGRDSLTRLSNSHPIWPTRSWRWSGVQANEFDSVMRAWGEKITSFPGKGIACLCSVLLMSAGIYGALHIQDGFNGKFLTSTEKSHYSEFTNVYCENFHLNAELNIIFPGEVGQSTNDIERMYSHLESIHKSNKHFVSGSIFWLPEYLSRAKKKSIDTKNENAMNETIKILTVAGISILLVSFMFLNNFATTFCLLCGFLSYMLELLFLMYIRDISLNSLSTTYIVLALGIYLDYNAHVVYRFASSKASTPELRVVNALEKVGSSVLFGGISTLSGIMPMAFASSTVFQTFFKIFVGTVVLGLLHGLVILPLSLILLGKTFDIRETNVDSTLLKWFKLTRKTKSNNGTTSTSSPECNPENETCIPVAIVGIGCRFPGANSKDAFWDMLIEGRSAISSYPINRPDAREFIDHFNPGKDTPGKHYVLSGAFLENITGFDAQFFGISPNESRSMDPQQRILLQVVYEAIEDAGICLDDLQQCRTGVYVGSMNIEYSSLVLDQSNIRNIDQFSSTGCALSVIANRISFSLNLTGPSLTLDTACSSSLVALDIAFAHLQSGECDVAIVCAPNILLTGKRFHTACCKTGLLAQDGRCKSFDIKADGYGRGEGVAAVVIKPTQAAVNHRDNVYAEVVACGTNNDGQTAIPMTAPSAVTQTALFQRVLQESGLSKDDIQYVEAHGTGTAVGDVVEMESLSTVYGNSRKRVLRLGSVKSNINHTESTAGLAGIIKTCLMIKHAQFVPTVNVHEVKPQLKMSERRMMVQVCNEPWETEGDKLRKAAVSSYGFGGANAHAIVRQVTNNHETIVPSRRLCNRVITLSAASKGALTEMARKVSLSLQTKPDDDELLKDNICYSLNERYTKQSHRLAVSFSSFQDAANALELYASQKKGWDELVVTGHVSKPRTKIVFLYGGQGAEWFGMAREMLVHEPKFKKSVEKIDALLKRYRADWSLIEELNKSDECSRLHKNPIAQTALFAIHFALTELLESWGVTPSAVVGHSLGEISAAWASGVLRLNKALQLVLFRSQLQEKCSPTGCMAAIGLDEEDARRLLQNIHLVNKVDIAVKNSPGNVVLSGDKEFIDLVESHVMNERSDVFWRKLTTSRAYHSREMEGIKESYFKLTKKFNVRQNTSNIPFYSTVTGTQLSGHLLSLEHWWKNIRQAVLLEPALKTIFSHGNQFFIEINAAPQLSYHVHQTWSHNKPSASLNANETVVVQTLPKRAAKQQHLSFLQNCIAHLFAHGVPLSWNRIQGSGSKSFLPRPEYPWQETEFWYRDAYPPEFVSFLKEKKSQEKKASNEGTTFHPLLGKTVPTKAFTGIHAWESEVSLHNVTYIKDHKFSESVEPIIPAAVYVELMFAMSFHMAPNTAPYIDSISFDNLLTLSENDSYRLRTRLLPDEHHGKENAFQITIVESNENEVVLSHGSIQLGIGHEYGINEIPPEKHAHSIEFLKVAMGKVSIADFKKEREKLGFLFGPQFDLITEAWSNNVEALSLICPTKEIISDASIQKYVIHPSIIDACFQTSLLPKNVKSKFVPKRMTDISIVQKTTCAEPLYAYVKILDCQEEIPVYKFTLMDQHGRPVMIISKFFTAEVSPTKLTFEEAAFTFCWKKLASSEGVPARGGNVWLILRDQSNYAERFYHHISKYERVAFVDAQDTKEKTRIAFVEILDELLSQLKKDEKLQVINFWPVDASKFDANSHYFDVTHWLAFESCLVISQEILKRENFDNHIQLIFVTTCAVNIFEIDQNPTDSSDIFPWSASVFGFRRAFSEEIEAQSAAVIDLPLNPSDQDLYAMVQDITKGTLEEESVFRSGVRYVNRMERLDSRETQFKKHKSPCCKDENHRPFRMISISGDWFLQKASSKRMSEGMEIEVLFACSILHKPWQDLKTNDCVTIAGKLLCNAQDQQNDYLVVGVCKVDDLGNYVAAKRCCFTEMKADFTAQQAASVGFPMVMSYYILEVLLGDVQGRKVLIYHESAEICFIFACVAASFDKEIVCLVKNQSIKERMNKFENVVAVTEDEITSVAQNDARCIDVDAVCLLSRKRTYVICEIMKHLKPGASVVTVYGQESVTFNPLTHDKYLKYIFTSWESIIENTKGVLKSLDSCCTAMQSKGLLKFLLNIPQPASSIYDIVNCGNASSSREMKTFCNDRAEKEPCFHTISFQPKIIPDKVVFHNVPLDDNGFKGDRTYLVIGGVRGFGFEVARWMVKNGAKTVMCTARSAPSEGKIAEVQQLERHTGSRILLRQADVTSWEEMNVIKHELESLPDVAGIVFTAMVLADQLLKNADLKTCKSVVETKVKGSVILHQLSLAMDLDFFIMFSSISGVLGNVGQVSYAAANSFLDQLCEYRKQRLGLPALSVNWGPIIGAGVLERNTNITSILERNGFLALHYTTG